ncbi:SDR family oxidoreductase [Falsigemmobacter faecalis]|uniref:SDR family oxidoreductase n=1 Tax=Falsigemmobacter faecalis TaxID=2488730 RepID=A0A3P3DH60_9RHOB|nr:SDR family oxidoreductase [Falsigemmobacter faecalis]RRH73016.1 SDR family oxidoreductase [Falsigemmobacter faecalis]
MTKLAIITGAAGGIGQALLAEFAETGHRLVAVDLPGSGVAEILAPYGAEHLSYELDLGDEAQIAAFWSWFDAQNAPVDVLVNNAALGPSMAPTLETPLSDFRRTFQVNIYGPFAMAREAAKRMQPGGVIVNTASQAGVLGNPRRNAYAASKAALISMTKSLAAEWASKGIRVNAVAPGYIRTPMVAELERSGKADLALVRQRIPLGRIGRPDEIASVLAWLASPQARYVTGSVVAVDGGWQAFNQPGHAHPPVDGAPPAELARPAAREGARVVLITGSGRGIGAATARRFAKAGDSLILVDREGAEVLAAELGPQHLGLNLDLTEDAAVERLFAGIAARFGRVDVMVNNAAVADQFKPAFEQSGEDLARTLEVNVTAAFHCARESLRLMPAGGGVIVNIGSINSFLPFAPRHAYGASKAAIDVMTRCLAAELGPEGRRVVTVAPGYMRTPATADLEAQGRIDIKAIRRRIPMGDMGRPEDIADAVWFAASEKASYFSGAILYVDGGWTSFGNAGVASGDDSDPQDFSL